MIELKGTVRDRTTWAQSSDRVLTAARMAGSSAVRAMRAEASRQIRERKAIKRSRVSDAISLVFPTSKERLVWSVVARKALMPVSAFPHRQTKRGVSVEINVGGRKVIRGAFVAKMKSGHEGVFTRVGKGRLPIREAFTTQVADAFKDAIPAMTTRGGEVFRASFLRILPRFRPR